MILCHIHTQMYYFHKPIWLKLPVSSLFPFLEIDFKRKLDRITMNGNHYHLPEQKAAIKISTSREKKKRLLILWEALPLG